MRLFEAAGKIKEVQPSSNEKAKYVGLEAKDGAVLWVFVPPELNDERLKPGAGVFLRGFAKRHAERDDWWGLVAVQAFLLDGAPPFEAQITLVGDYAGTRSGHYLVRGLKGETYEVRGEPPSGIAAGDRVAVRGVPVTEEPGRLAVEVRWAKTVRGTRVLEEKRPAPKKSQPAPAPAAASPRPEPAPKKPAPPQPAPAAEEKPKRKGLLGGLFGRK